VIDRDAAARFGIQPQVIDDTLYDAFGQRQITQYFSQVNSYHLILEVMPSQVGDVATLNKLYVHSSTGQSVPLSTFVKVDTRGAATVDQPPEPVPRGDRFVQPGVGRRAGQAVDAINAAVKLIGVPQAVQGIVPGHRAGVPVLAVVAALPDRRRADHGLHHPGHPVRKLHPAADHPVHPAIGRRWRAADPADLAHYELSVIALIGMILLIGIVKKNGIMMVDFAITAERRDGLSPHEAIRQACLLRFRPILMTTMAAMLTGLPLMLGHGAGSELRRPLGFAMVGGLMLSQVLTLYTTPVIYLYLDRLQHRLSRRRSRLPHLAEKMGSVAD
jgi:multidrug efflux pump subunit AcrB